MTPEEEAILSEYESVESPARNVQIVRSRNSGQICVKKQVPADRAAVYQFLQEHPDPYTPKLFSCIQDGASLILLEEYLPGQTLKQVIQDCCLPDAGAANIIKTLCQALQPLHGAQPPVFCGNLNADTVIITQRGTVKLMDSALSGRQQDADFAAPEQSSSPSADSRTDIYALGILLNFLLTGRSPEQQLASGPCAPVIRRCTDPDPQNRFQQAEELEAALHTALASPPDPPARESRPEAGSIPDAEWKPVHAPEDTWSQVAHTGWQPEEDDSADDDTRHSGIVRFVLSLPGFRSRKRWKMVMAVCVYVLLFLFWFTMDLTVDGVAITGLQLRLEQLIFWLNSMIFICIFSNWHGWRERLPLIRSEKRLTRELGYCLVAVVLGVEAIFISLVISIFLI